MVLPHANFASEANEFAGSLVLEMQNKNIYSVPAFATDLFLLFRPTNGSQIGVLRVSGSRNLNPDLKHPKFIS
jgi:hypothetical protein